MTAVIQSARLCASRGSPSATGPAKDSRVQGKVAVEALQFIVVSMAAVCLPSGHRARHAALRRLPAAGSVLPSSQATA